MQQSVQQPSKSSWVTTAWRGLVKLDFISNFFTWAMELLARFAEPLASLSAIYIIIVAGVPVLLNDHLYTLALALIIGSPELLVVGAFKIATREISAGNKKGWFLVAACFVLLLLTAITVGDLFIWHWHQDVTSILMGCRCLAGIAYTFTRGIATDESEPVNVAQGSPVHSLLAEFTASIQQTVDQVNQSMVVEVNQIRQSLLSEVNRQHQQFVDEVYTALQTLAQQQQQLTSTVNSMNREVQVELANAMEVLGQQSQAALDTAVERLAHANSQRLEAVYSRIEQVRVTLESNPALPSVDAPRSQFRQLPARVNQVVHQSTSEPQNVHIPSVNTTGVNGEDASDGSKVNAGRAFTVNHYRATGVLPALAMIQTAVICSKTLASRARGFAEVDLGLKVNSGE